MEAEVIKGEVNFNAGPMVGVASRGLEDIGSFIVVPV